MGEARRRHDRKALAKVLEPLVRALEPLTSIMTSRHNLSLALAHLLAAMAQTKPPALAYDEDAKAVDIALVEEMAGDFGGMEREQGPASIRQAKQFHRACGIEEIREALAHLKPREAAGEFKGWIVGQRMHAHLGTCIVCGSREGDTVVRVEVRAHPSLPGEIMLTRNVFSSRLCPRCRPEYLPLTPATSGFLDGLCDKVWDKLRSSGSPSGLAWQEGWGAAGDDGRQPVH
jgi:hypothetical protein